MSHGTFYRLLDRLKASGMRTVLIPSSVHGKAAMARYTASSIKQLIARAADRERELC